MTTTSGHELLLSPAQCFTCVICLRHNKMLPVCPWPSDLLSVPRTLPLSNGRRLPHRVTVRMECVTRTQHTALWLPHGEHSVHDSDNDDRDCTSEAQWVSRELRSSSAGGPAPAWCQAEPSTPNVGLTAWSSPLPGPSEMLVAGVQPAATYRKRCSMR